MARKVLLSQPAGLISRDQRLDLSCHIFEALEVRLWLRADVKDRSSRVRFAPNIALSSLFCAFSAMNFKLRHQQTA